MVVSSGMYVFCVTAGDPPCPKTMWPDNNLQDAWWENETAAMMDKRRQLMKSFFLRFWGGVIGNNRESSGYLVSRIRVYSTMEACRNYTVVFVLNNVSVFVILYYIGVLLYINISLQYVQYLYLTRILQYLFLLTDPTYCKQSYWNENYHLDSKFLFN